MFLTRLYALCLYININIGTSFIFNLKRFVQLKTRVFFLFLNFVEKNEIGFLFCRLIIRNLMENVLVYRMRQNTRYKSKAQQKLENMFKNSNLFIRSV